VPVPWVFSPMGSWDPHVSWGLEGDGQGKEKEGGTDWWEDSWMLSLPSVFLRAELAPLSRVFAVASPSILMV